MNTINTKNIINQNKRKTIYVFITYIIIFIFLGLTFDVLYIASTKLVNPNTTFFDIFLALIQFKYLPFITLIMSTISIIIIFISIYFGNRLILSGLHYSQDETDILYQKVYNLVDNMRIASGNNYMPQVYLINDDYMNAFASGWNKENALIAVTRSLAENLNYNELESVIGHEMTHINHYDIRLTLILGILNNIMLFLLDWIYLSNLGRRNNNNNKARNQAEFILLILKIFVPLITFFLNLFLSRTREYMADAGSIELTKNPTAMKNALIKISEYPNKSIKENNSRKAAYIFNKESFFELFSTHPSLKNRIAAIDGKMNKY